MLPVSTGANSVQYGQGGGGIFLSNVRCTGSEDAIINCTHSGIGVHTCTHSKDVGVRCRGLLPSLEKVSMFFHSGVFLYSVAGNCTHGYIQLTSGLNELQGTVEVCVQGVMVAVCDRYWDSLDAAVTCRQLGFSSLGNNHSII